jgi:hypothetical protein
VNVGTKKSKLKRHRGADAPEADRKAVRVGLVTHLAAVGAAAVAAVLPRAAVIAVVPEVEAEETREQEATALADPHPVHRDLVLALKGKMHTGGARSSQSEDLHIHQNQIVVVTSVRNLVHHLKNPMGVLMIEIRESWL